MKKIVSKVVRLYSLLLFRFYGWVQMIAPLKQNPSENDLFSRAVWVFHVYLWVNLFTVLAIIRLLLKAIFEPINFIYFSMVLTPIATYLVERYGGVKVIRNMRKELKESPEEEKKKAKKIVRSYTVVSFVCVVLALFANNAFNKAQDIEEIKSTPEYQQMQESSKERQKWYEQRKREQEEKMFQRQYPRGMDRISPTDSLQR